MSPYIQALRSGAYLKFLDWPRAIMSANERQRQDADNAVALLANEWLSDFCDEDVTKVAELYAFSELPSKPFQGNIAYALTSISMAVLHCMVCKTGKNENDPDFGEEMSAQQEIFDSRVQAVTEEQKQRLHQQLMPMLTRRYKVDAYITHLNTSSSTVDALQGTRLSVAIALAKYLGSETEYNEGVIKEVDTFVSKLRELNPTVLEQQEYLNFLAKPQMLFSGYQMMANLSVAFFMADPKNEQHGKAGDLGAFTPF